MCRAVSTISFLPFTLLKGLAVPILWMRELRLQRAKETRSGPPLYMMEGFWHQKVCPEQLSSAPAALMPPLLWCLPSPTGPQFPSPVKKKALCLISPFPCYNLIIPCLGLSITDDVISSTECSPLKCCLQTDLTAFTLVTLFRSQPPKAVIIVHS